MTFRPLGTLSWCHFCVWSLFRDILDVLNVPRDRRVIGDVKRRVCKTVNSLLRLQAVHTPSQTRRRRPSHKGCRLQTVLPWTTFDPTHTHHSPQIVVVMSWCVDAAQTLNVLWRRTVASHCWSHITRQWWQLHSRNHTTKNWNTQPADRCTSRLHG